MDLGVTGSSPVVPNHFMHTEASHPPQKFCGGLFYLIACLFIALTFSRYPANIYPIPETAGCVLFGLWPPWMTKNPAEETREFAGHIPNATLGDLRNRKVVLLFVGPAE